MGLFGLLKRTPKQLWVLVLLLIATVIFHGSIQVNYNANNLKRYSVDEYHTVYQGIQSISSGEVENFRALEGSRWIVRAFYPGALIGMNKNMGGNVKNNTWGYPGHNYLRKHYRNKSYGKASVLHPNMNDPNIRDFMFYLRLQNVFLCMLSILALVLFSWKNGYWFTSFLLATALGLNYYLLVQRSILYIDGSYFALLNLLILFYFFLFQSNRISYFLVLFAAFLSAFLLSVKFSCVFFIVLLVLTIVYKERFAGVENMLKKVLLFLIFFVISFKAINLYAFKDENTLSKAIHQFFSNFWKYSTGVDLNQNYWSYVEGMIDVFQASIGYLIYIVPIVILIGFLIQSKKDRLKFGALVVCLFITLLTILDQKKFIARNFVPFLGVLVLITGVYVELTIKFASNYFKKRRIKLMAFPILSLVILFGIIREQGGTSKFMRNIFPDATENIAERLRDIDNIGQRPIVFIGIDQSEFNEVKGAKIRTLASYPVVGNSNFGQVRDSIRKLVDKPDVVIVNRIENNKQYTNFLLPKLYNQNEQFGNYFIFFNSENN